MWLMCMIQVFAEIDATTLLRVSRAVDHGIRVNHAAGSSSNQHLVRVDTKEELEHVG
jgi:hypothetical protein